MCSILRQPTLEGLSPRQTRDDAAPAAARHAGFKRIARERVAAGLGVLAILALVRDERGGQVYRRRLGRAPIVTATRAPEEALEYPLFRRLLWLGLWAVRLSHSAVTSFSTKQGCRAPGVRLTLACQRVEKSVTDGERTSGSCSVEEGERIEELVWTTRFHSRPWERMIKGPSS